MQWVQKYLFPSRDRNQLVVSYPLGKKNNRRYKRCERVGSSGLGGGRAGPPGALSLPRIPCPQDEGGLSLCVSSPAPQGAGVGVMGHPACCCRE